MGKEKKRKTLIAPKVRLLLWIYLHGVKNESNYLTKLADQIGYSKGSLESHIIPRLLQSNLIESLNLDKRSPPYKVTEKGKKFLQPILFVRKAGMGLGIWVGLWALIDFVVFYNQPILMVSSWVPLLVVSFLILALMFLFYPYFLVKFGKTSYYE